jgi:hypothetical protein
LLLVGGLVLILAAYVGISAAVGAHQQHERDARYNSWVTQAEAITEARLPGLLGDFAAVPFPADLHQTSGPAARLPGKFTGAFGPWQAARPSRAEALEIADALRGGHFANVTVAEVDDGWKVTGAKSGGNVTIYVNANGPGSRVSGFLSPDIPACC